MISSADVQELTELITIYLEARLSFRDRLRVQMHLGTPLPPLPAANEIHNPPSWVPARRRSASGAGVRANAPFCRLERETWPWVANRLRSRNLPDRREGFGSRPRQNARCNPQLKKALLAAYVV
jgi:hypothetical protein